MLSRPLSVLGATVFTAIEYCDRGESSRLTRTYDYKTAHAPNNFLEFSAVISVIPLLGGKGRCTDDEHRCSEK